MHMLCCTRTNCAYFQPFLWQYLLIVLSINRTARMILVISATTMPPNTTASKTGPKATPIPLAEGLLSGIDIYLFINRFVFLLSIWSSFFIFSIFVLSSAAVMCIVPQLQGHLFELVAFCWKLGSQIAYVVLSTPLTFSVVEPDVLSISVDVEGVV